MSKTPEAKVKDAIKKVLESYGVHQFNHVQDVAGAVGMYYMPVAGPFAVHGVHDFVGCWAGKFFSIEAKAPNAKEDATQPQRTFQGAVIKSGGVSLIGVRSGEAVHTLKEMLGV